MLSTSLPHELRKTDDSCKICGKGRSDQLQKWKPGTQWHGICSLPATCKSHLSTVVRGCALNPHTGSICAGENAKFKWSLSNIIGMHVTAWRAHLLHLLLNYKKGSVMNRLGNESCIRAKGKPI